MTAAKMTHDKSKMTHDINKGDIWQPQRRHMAIIKVTHDIHKGDT